MLLSLTLLGVAASAQAAPARETRYGPQGPRPETAVRLPYDGPTLGWTGKRDKAALAAAAVPAGLPRPVAAWARYGQASSPARPAGGVPIPPPPPPPAAVSAAVSAAAPARIAALPTSLYSPPAAQAAPQGAGPRFYSVGRQYGMTPDALPPPEPGRMVLIEASAPPPEPKGGEPPHGSAEWLAAGSADQDDEDKSPS